MRKILILGAGRSASSLIHYLIKHADQQEWRITVADKDVGSAKRLVHEGPEVATGVQLDATDGEARSSLIGQHDLVISMLPAFMHMDVLKDCLRLKKHVITPSYVPDALWPMDAEFKAAGLIVLNEMGLDPGIDHMSAMRILDRIRQEGGRMESFESYCGGLVAPESDDNPWGYKFSCARGTDPTQANVLAPLSAFFWGVLVIVSLKYVWVVLRFDNEGEGGVLALTALAHRVSSGSRWASLAIAAGIFAAALFYDDAMITPPISVLSAIEGLKVITPALEPYVLPITLAIIVALFSVQARGYRKCGLTVRSHHTRLVQSIGFVWPCTHSRLSRHPAFIQPDLCSVEGIFQNLVVGSRTQAVACAIEQGLFPNM